VPVDDEGGEMEPTRLDTVVLHLEVQGLVVGPELARRIAARWQSQDLTLDLRHLQRCHVNPWLLSGVRVSALRAIVI
jgi:hypothetical protein